MILSPPRSVRVSTCGFFPSLFMLWNKLFSIRIRCPLKAQEDSLATWRVPGSSELAFPVSGVVFSVLTSHRKVYSSKKKKMEGGTKTRLEPASSRGAGTSRNFTSCSQQRSGGPCHMWRSGLRRIDSCRENVMTKFKWQWRQWAADGLSPKAKVASQGKLKFPHGARRKSKGDECGG